MKVRYQSKQTGEWIEGFSNKFNTHGLSEVVAGFDDGSYDSCFIKDLEVFIPDIGWMDMSKAFGEKHIIPNNLNTNFGIPVDNECFERGFNP